jgi:hypothetical protein
MGIIDWLIKTHENDMSKKAIRRLRDGYPIPGDVQRAVRGYNRTVDDIGDILVDPLNQGISDAERKKALAAIRKPGRK